MTKTEQLENYLINYKKHTFSKSIKITLKKENELLVTLPIYCPYKKARDFVLSNFEKIKSFKMPKNDISEDIKTKFDTLEIIKSDSFKTVSKKGKVYFYYPDYLDFNSSKIQKELMQAYKKALKIEAKNYLPERLEFLSKKFCRKQYKFSI